eukprot:CAMPEP_0172202520 /NCGR_PEP_ID=MMETSP1050-20130122/30703_1 /TAXON_ID=233186 /ORGANISM="Cryptomonas curvata, Strain CCAP979/52" /LENGTH=164 /DNA_ID=CAMNT_0012880491 /DNA_START=45 /DNA_END=536 /DNA_ORIENTATION=+
MQGGNTKGLEVLCEEWNPPQFAVLGRGQVYDGCEEDHNRELAAWIIQVPLSDLLDRCDLDVKGCDWGLVLDKMVTHKLESIKDDIGCATTQSSLLSQQPEEARMIKKMTGGRLIITDGHLECHSDYTTALSSVSVSAKGRWMFEATLESVMGNAKVGWASSNCR